MIVVRSLTPLDVATLVLGIIGTTTGLAALAWNVAAFRLSGHRLDMELTHGLTISLNENGRPQLPGSWNLTVRVSNQGRQPVNVQGLDCIVDGEPKRAVSWTAWTGRDPLPHRLEPQSESVWRCESPDQLVGALRAMTGRSNIACRVVAVLPGGKRQASNAVVMDKESALAGLDVSLVNLSDDARGE